ncbi:MAG: hypothetical protein NW241_11430 [Bacteroidia bacterium]|nr:hypothetical protein [Bacteroidia bacterium]
MHLLLFQACLALAQACAPAPSASAPPLPYVWEERAHAAPYDASYNYQMFALQDRFWVFHPDGVFMSADSGRTWTPSGLEDAVDNQAFLDYVVFKDAVYALGTFRGNIERFRWTSRIARTTDLRTWETVAESSGLPRRYFYHPVVFQGKIWIFGGEDEQRQYDDAWYSEDAVHWTKAASGLPFGARASQHFVEFNGRLYMLGHDVWSSADGLQWVQETPLIADANLFGYAALVFDGKIWLVGCNRANRFTSETFWSADGRSWHTQAAPWSPRGGVAAAALGGYLLMTGGKFGGPEPDGRSTRFVYSNDVWAMRKAE